MYLLVTGFYAFLSHLDYLYAAVAAYLCGCFNGALFTSRLFFHDDVRTHGSGNAGLTNFYRTYGARYALLVIACDMLKAVAAVSLAAWLGARFDPRMLPDLPLTAAEQAEYVLHFKYWAGFFCVVGHMFPCTAKFRGGKGILCGGTLAWMLGWKVGLVAWGLFAALWLLSKYVSLGSIFAGVSLTVSVFLFYGHNLLYTALAFVISVLVVWCHRENINRLLHGTERKFKWHSGPPKE